MTVEFRTKQLIVVQGLGQEDSMCTPEVER